MDQKKIRLTLGRKLLLLILAMCAVICAVALGGTYLALRASVRAYAEDTCQRISKRVAQQADLDALAADVSGIDPYGALRDEMQSHMDDTSMKRLSIVLPDGGDWVTFASVVSDGESATSEQDEAAQLTAAVRERLSTLKAGETPATLFKAQRVTTFWPVWNEDGSVAGCILCEMDVDALALSGNEKLGWMAAVLILVVLAAAAACMLVIRRIVTRPIQQLTDAVQAYEVGENKASLRSLELKGSEELRCLADSFRMMLVEIDLRSFEERELAVREERVEAELKLTAAVNNAMLPKELPKSPEEAGFDIRGLTDQSSELNCDFYDYFMLEDGKLCLVVGSVPSEGVSAALFMVVAKTTIRSQLRVGLPLLEAVTKANRQLFEVGQGMVVDAFVGILDQKGVLSYVNAGQRQPLLMRAEDRYEWQHCPVYAPLGQNENVTYRVQQLQLFQGDRMFFHTDGLANISGEDGAAFDEQRMQAMLNVSRSKHFNGHDLLVYMSAEGKAFAKRLRDVTGFSLLVLDYLRSRKDLAHCVVDRDHAGGMELSAFLKRQLTENGFSRRAIAQTVVLADEIFALCCRQKTEGLVTVECAVDQELGAMTISWKSPFGGKNPLDAVGGSDMDNALAFIRKNVREVSFQPGELQDILTVTREIAETDCE